jgi:hypothetical protein
VEGRTAIRCADAAGVAPATDQTAAVAKHVTRAIFALKTPSPDGSQHYQSGWDDGLEAAMDAARDALAAVLPAPVDRATVLREEAARIRAHCPDHLNADSAEGSWMVCHCDVADDIERRLAAPSAVVVRRATDEAQGEAQPPVQCTASVLRKPHGPHRWEPQPGMDPIPCPGFEAVEAQQLEPRQPCTCGQDGCEYCDVQEEPLLCPRCGNDIGDYGEDDFVFRTGDDRPYCSGECVIAAHRTNLPKEA